MSNNDVPPFLLKTTFVLKRKGALLRVITMCLFGKNTRLPLRKRPNIFGLGKTNCVGFPRKTPPLAG